MASLTAQAAHQDDTLALCALEIIETCVATPENIHGPHASFSFSPINSFSNLRRNTGQVSSRTQGNQIEGHQTSATVAEVHLPLPLRSRTETWIRSVQQILMQEFLAEMDKIISWSNQHHATLKTTRPCQTAFTRQSSDASSTGNWSASTMSSPFSSGFLMS